MMDDPCKYSLEESLAHLVARLYRSVMKQVNRALSEEGLHVTLQEWPVLMLVWDENGLSQNALARKLFKDKTTIARLVVGIESSGLDVKGERPDRREKGVFLTEKGKTIMDKATAKVVEIDGVAGAGVSEAHLRICRNVLRRAHINLAR